jgi:hypothetical protein
MLDALARARGAVAHAPVVILFIIVVLAIVVAAVAPDLPPCKMFACARD